MEIKLKKEMLWEIMMGIVQLQSHNSEYIKQTKKDNNNNNVANKLIEEK